MALSDAAIRAAKAQPKQFKHYDEGGLFLTVRPSGGKLWHLKYRHLGKEQLLSLGIFPDVGLKEARKRRASRSPMGSTRLLRRRRRRSPLPLARPTPSRPSRTSSSPSGNGKA